MRASLGLSTNIATRIEPMITMSVRMVNTPNDMVSLSASTSEVVRVSRPPMVLLSKKRLGRRSTWANTARRTS